MNDKLDEALKKQKAVINSIREKQKENSEKKPLDVVTILSLPTQLRKTALAIQKSGKATAAMIARDTGREEAIETKYLTQLVNMGYLKMDKQASETYFHI